MILRNRLLLFLSILLLGCGSTKNVTEIEVLPDWVKTKPIISGYYVGLGSAQKTMNPNEYQSGAKNNALADLTSDISVTISTESVLHQFESSMAYSEDYSSLTKTLAKENLEQYELINSYESQTHYYVLYSLSKEKYKAIKDKRKSEAVKKGINYLLNAQEQKAKIKIYDAIFNYVKGLESVKTYLSESLECEIKGNYTDLGNELYTGLISTINNIIVVPNVSEIDATRGMSISADQLSFLFKTSEGNPIQGLPVAFSFGIRPLRSNKAETDSEGKVNYEIQKSGSKTGTGYFTAKLDVNEVATHCASDPFLRKMLRNMDVPKGSTFIKVENPTFFVETNELNFSKELNPKVLKKKMEQLLTNNDYPVVYKKENANYIIEVNTNTAKQKKEGRMFYATLSGEIKVFNADLQLLFLRPIDDVEGVQLNYNEAGFDAYNNLSNYLTRNFLPKLKEALY